MSDKVITHSKLISTTPDQLWELLVDPSRHSEIDGSGTVQGSRVGAERLTAVGDTFGMSMRYWGVVPYKITNTVVTFEDGREIAWRHFGRHVWRWQLEPAEGGTMVTESFEWDQAFLGPTYGPFRILQQNDEAIQKTLEHLQGRFAA
ncbi:MAG: SRPBCC family protein [Actinomycetota bacterium]